MHTSNIFIPCFSILLLLFFDECQSNAIFQQKQIFGGTRFSKILIFENLTLSLEDVFSHSLIKAQNNEKLLKEILKRNANGGFVNGCRS